MLKVFVIVFRDCTSLQQFQLIYLNILLMLRVFQSCFYNCTSLTTIPTDLFKYTVNVTTFEYCFQNCRNLALPTSIFNLSALQTKQPVMTQCFRPSSTADSHTGTVQPIFGITLQLQLITIVSSNCTALNQLLHQSQNYGGKPNAIQIYRHFYTTSTNNICDD